MKSKKSPVGKLPDVYTKFFQKLDNETLERISQNKEVAFKFARTGRMQTKPDKINEENIESIGNEMQILARTLLEERGVLGES